MQSYCTHGKGQDKYDNVRIGMNSRLDTLQAAVLLEKMKFFDEEVEKCNRVTEEHTKCLKSIVKTPIVCDDMLSSWAQYTICFHNNSGCEAAQRILKDSNIPSDLYYKKSMHKLYAFKLNVFKELDYEITENVCGCCLSLLVHSYLHADYVRAVIDRILQVYN